MDRDEQAKLYEQAMGRGALERERRAKELERSCKCGADKRGDRSHSLGCPKFRKSRPR